MINCLRRLLAYILFFAAVSAPKAYGATPYAGFNYYTVGGGRVLAMGGTSVALSDGASGLTQNPAGAALGKWKFDLGAASNRVTNQSEAPGGLSGFNATYQDPFSFQSYALAAQFHALAFGVGYSTPYEYKYTDISARERSIDTAGTDGLLALRLTESFAVGVSVHALNLTERFAEPSLPVDETRKSTATSYKAGAVYKTKNYGFGVTYEPSYQFKMDETAMTQTSVSGLEWFRKVSVPEVLSVGGFFRFNPHFLFAVDVDTYQIPEGVTTVLSGLSNGDAGEIPSGATPVIRGGFEWAIQKEKEADISFRGGAYNEPTLYKNGVARVHTTFGLLVRFGPAVLEVSFDQASNFTNTSQGFSIAVGDI